MPNCFNYMLQTWISDTVHLLHKVFVVVVLRQFIFCLFTHEECWCINIILSLSDGVIFGIFHRFSWQRNGNKLCVSAVPKGTGPLLSFFFVCFLFFLCQYNKTSTDELGAFFCLSHLLVKVKWFTENLQVSNFGRPAESLENYWARPGVQYFISS